ncbi:MAG TPA: SGNH/GDSL hydrolase family protein [Tepidiformaceae bacterium]|nr:SGNH/GDSL hydrolase family protein [Tepidiformaceae bacterium]
MPTILYLGRSDLKGYGLRDPDNAWPLVLQRQLEEQTGLEIVTERRTLRMEGDPTEYIRNACSEARPDVVVILLTAYDFAVARVQDRLTQRVGKRFGDFARTVEVKTSPSDPRKKPSVLHRAIRRAARSFFGTAPMRTRADVVRTIDRAFSVLAGQEGVPVVVMYIVPGRGLSEQNPNYPIAAAQFSAEFQAKAAARHFIWSDTNVNDSGHGHRLGDGIHPTERGHEIIAGEMFDAVLAALTEVYPELGRMAPLRTPLQSTR